MKKVIVIGCPGSGKTTFAEKLNKCTGLPLYYLDAVWHKPDKTHIPREEFDQRITEIFTTPGWIIDGNYNRTIEMRLKQCDTVFLFDLPTEVCLQGAVERIGKDRYDLPWTEKELDPEFEGFIRDFAKTSLPKIYELIDKYKENRNVIVFKSREESDEFIKSMQRHKEQKMSNYNSETELFTPPCEVICQYNRIYSDPPEKVRVSGRALVTDGNRLLLSHELNTGVYMSPGGGLEDGETLAECCAREVKEETGYIVRPTKKFFVVNEYSFETLYISHYFICELCGKGETRLTETEVEHGIVPEWVSFDDALAVFGTYESKRDDHRSLYLREYTVLQKYLSEQNKNSDT